MVKTTGRMSRQLGTPPVKLPALAQGTTRTGSYNDATIERDRDRIDVLRYGIDLGLNFIDTAQMYGGGHGEEVAGQAIKGIRDEVFLAGKFNPGNSSAKGVALAVEGTLKRLQTDYLDLYQVHFPNPDVPMEETIGSMQDLVKAGKIRFIGVSNFTLAEMQAANAMAGPLGVVSNQVEYNLFQRTIEDDVLPYCQDQGATILAYSPLDQGASPHDGPRLRLLDALAEKYEKTVAQITLRWVVSRPSVVAIVKAARRKHVLDNANALEFDLLDEDIDQIDSMFTQEVFRVPPSRIRIDWEGASYVYGTADEARENKLDLIPAPESIAKNVDLGHLPKPLPLVPTKDASGAYDYDLLDNQIFYWAWVIAKGLDEPVPAFNKEA